MRLTFVANSYLDPRTPDSWSGLPYFIRRSLVGAGIEVETCVPPGANPTGSLLCFAYWKLFRGKRLRLNCDKRLREYYANQVELSSATVAGILNEVIAMKSSAPSAVV